MMFKWFIVIALCFCITCQGSIAKENGPYDTSALRSNQLNCEEAYSAPEEAMCASQLYNLNQEEENLYKTISDKAKGQKDFSDALTSSETAWQSYRDATCYVLADGLSGTQQTALIIDCLAERTKERITFLKGIANRFSKGN